MAVQVVPLAPEQATETAPLAVAEWLPEEALAAAVALEYLVLRQAKETTATRKVIRR